MVDQGLVEAQPVQEIAPANFTGSKITANSVLVDDSPDVLVLPPGVDPTTTTQSENSVFIHPDDPTKVLNSNNSTPFPIAGIFGTSGILSTDGGATWGGQITGTGGTNSGDPAAVIDLNGTYFIGYIANDGGNGTARSTDEGATWTHVQVAPIPGIGGLADKNHLWVDNSASSPFEGNLYAAWTDFGGVNEGNIVVSRSTDAGLTWSGVTNISSSISGFHQGVHIQTASNGDVFAFYTIYPGGTVQDEPAYGMSTSTDGGANWSSGTTIISNTRGVRSTGVGKGGIRNASFPVSAIDISGGPRDGYMYMVWPNIGVPGVNTGTEIDVYIIRSTDGGDNWSAPIRVNQQNGDGKKHFLPWITCDPVTGNLSVIFYDDRNVGASEVEVFVANSLDGGLTWEDFKVSDVSSTPAPIPGLATGYMGDYLAIAARNSQVYPVWTDNRASTVLTYTSPFVLADPDDPNPPSAVTAFSDNTTPASMQLDWTDPATLVDGTAIGAFTIEIERDGSPIASVASGTETYTDTGPAGNTEGGLGNGTFYSYTLTTKLTSNDSLSTPAAASAWAGGSPTPAAPTNLACSATETDATITWTDPTTQDDGTNLDDLDGINIYRDGSLVGTASPGDESFVDTPPLGFTYTYHVTAFDNENPVNESVSSNSETCYVGSVPDYLVWVGPDAGASAVASGDSLLEALGNNGVSSFLSNDLFEFGSDLSPYKAVFVVLGIYSNNHVIPANGPEGTALEAYLANGGCVYMEGSDCYNWDPDNASGHQVRPWFGLDDGPDGSGDVAGVDGLNELSAFNFSYNGENNFMDELQPNGSTAIWQNNANADISGVFYSGFGGNAIGVVPEFGGMTSGSGTSPNFDPTRGIGRAGISGKTAVKPPRDNNRPRIPFIKKAVYYPEKLAARKPFDEVLAKNDDGDPMIMANNQTDLMTAYLALFDHGGSSSYSRSYDAGWNMVSLGLQSSQTDYTVLFPDASGNPMFGWGGTYETATDLVIGAGYWLNFANGETANISGPVVNDLTVSLAAGWNMVGGPSCNLPVGNIGNNEIITGTIFGFDGAYFEATSLDQGTGYWINASEAGDILLDCFSGGNVGKVSQPGFMAGVDVRDVPTLQLENAAGFQQKLFYNASLSEAISKNAFLLPPVMPGMQFDARFAGDYRLMEGESAIVYLRSEAFPVSITMEGLTAEAGAQFVLEEMIDGKVGDAHIIRNGETIEILNPQVNRLKLSKVNGIIPTEFALEQNFPNPFNPVTQIRYALPEKSDITVEIYNALGQRIKTLISGKRDAGFHTITWDATNDAGQQVSSGIYLYRVTAGSNSGIKKMILLK